MNSVGAVAMHWGHMQPGEAQRRQGLNRNCTRQQVGLPATRFQGFETATRMPGNLTEATSGPEPLGLPILPFQFPLPARRCVCTGRRGYPRRHHLTAFCRRWQETGRSRARNTATARPHALRGSGPTKRSEATRVTKSYGLRPGSRLAPAKGSQSPTASLDRFLLALLLLAAPPLIAFGVETKAAWASLRGASRTYSCRWV